MTSTKVFLLVLWLAVCVGICRPWCNDFADDAKAKADEAKKFATEAVHNAKEKTESWADWVHDEFSESFGLQKDREKQATQNMKYNAEDAASRATETMRSAASRASEYASQKGMDAKQAISGAMIIRMPSDRINDAKDTMGEAMAQARERMGDTYEDAKQKMYTASDKASEKFYDAKDTMAEAMGNAKDKASDVYDEARQKISHVASGNANDDAKPRIKMASQKTYDVKNNLKGAMNYGRDKANDAEDKMGVAIGYGSDKVAETFDQAKNKVGEAYVTAKNTMTEEDKAKYEAAKEKASEATGNLGAKMRNSPKI
ncbi:late embryogenesis abundant protein, group 3-like [Gastrolobium bilobum]|uniref:late embryogenesis abundant protein, group 3-like n=1 Tax=Gastrolobium bilobum TaxID=150636 RepID=UPI002AB25CDE|nr:late embryogenesis abundant protein, group 3-like [Gastrolobium bilobum]